MENREVSKSKEGSLTSLKFQESVQPLNVTKTRGRSMSDGEKKANEADLKRQWERDKEMVRGIFRYHECPRGVLAFPFLKYKWDEMTTYNLKDGEVYELPRMVAVHLNTNCSYPTYNYKNNVHGQPEVTVSERVRRTSFQSLEFVDVDEKAVIIKNATSPIGSYSMNSALPN